MINTLFKRSSIVFLITAILPSLAVVVYWIVGMLAYAVGKSIDIGMHGGQIAAGWGGVTIVLLLLSLVSYILYVLTEEI